MHWALTRPARQVGSRNGGPSTSSSSLIPHPSFFDLTCLLLFACRVAVAHAEDWPQWRGPRSDGSWHGPKLPERWPEAGLPVVWRKPIGGGYGGLAVANGRLYVQDKQKEPAEQEQVLCFDAASGELLWQHAYPVQYGKLDYGNGPRATPTIHHGRVYTLGAVGHVHCLDAASGEVVWQHDLVKDFGAKLQEWGLAASPVIWRDLVIFHPGLKQNGCFVAFDRQSGREVWRAGADPAGYSTPIIVGEGDAEQLVGWTPEHILGINPRDGSIHWSVPYKVTYGVSIATPICHCGIVFVTGYWEGSKAIRLGRSPAESALLWQDKKNLQGLMAQPLARAGYVYTLDKDQGLLCCEIATGRILWTDDHQMTPRGRNPHAVLQWLGDSDRAIILNAEGDLVLARLTPDGYEEESRTNIIQPAPGPIWTHPAFAGDCVFARNDVEIVCVKLPVDD